MPKHQFHCAKKPLKEKIVATNVDIEEKANRLKKKALEGQTDDSSFEEARAIYEAAKANFARMKKVAKTASERLRITTLERKNEAEFEKFRKDFYS